MDIICYSHLRWNFVYQRPQQIMSRLAKQFRVFFIEEPIFDAGGPSLEHTQTDEQVQVIVVHLAPGTNHDEAVVIQNELLTAFFRERRCRRFIAWYYTPMALALDISVEPELVVYDCMDELSAFKNAPPEIKTKEARLMELADLIFTGGQSLYEAKKAIRRDSHLFPSSIDRLHFEKAKKAMASPPDQQHIPHPRIGFFGVVDERMDIDLLQRIAEKRPDWHFVIIGPVVKIDPESLPKKDNIHFLGSKDYKMLPAYISTWHVAIMPFALNDSTRFISPTKTPEYLAAGKPVVSTPVHDVVKNYGEPGLVLIADTPDSFIQAIERSFHLPQDPAWVQAVDEKLSENSWDKTVDHMIFHIRIAMEKRNEKKLIEKE